MVVGKIRAEDERMAPAHVAQVVAEFDPRLLIPVDRIEMTAHVQCVGDFQLRLVADRGEIKGPMRELDQSLVYEARTERGRDVPHVHHDRRYWRLENWTAR